MIPIGCRQKEVSGMDVNNRLGLAALVEGMSRYRVEGFKLPAPPLALSQ